MLNDEAGNKGAFQLIIDENFINAAFTNWVSIDKTFSVREFLGAEPRFAIFSQLLTTSTVGMALPNFKEEYGNNKAVDLILSINHEEILKHNENMPVSGVTLDQKGNYKVSLNIGANIVVEKKQGQWVDARNLVLTLSLKGKIFTTDDEF